MFDLKGLSSATPIGFMAGLGLMRVLVEDLSLDVRLAWKGGHAVLDGIDPADAIKALTTHMDGRAKAPEFQWADTLRRIPPKIYRNACTSMGSDKRALGFMAGWGTDSVLRDGFIHVTRMDMTSGQQKLLRDLRGLAQSVEGKDFESALLGGPYGQQVSFGLDPAAARSHAHEGKAPTKSKPPGKPGLIWLAFESIPLHPVVPVSASRTQTIGWQSPPDLAYVWPTWEVPLTLEEIRLLRALPVERLPERPGVSEVWASRYGKTGKYGTLLPAQRER